MFYLSKKTAAEVLGISGFSQDMLDKFSELPGANFGAVEESVVMGEYLIEEEPKVEVSWFVKSMLYTPTENKDERFFSSITLSVSAKGFVDNQTVSRFYSPTVNNAYNRLKAVLGELNRTAKIRIKQKHPDLFEESAEIIPFRRALSKNELIKLAASSSFFLSPEGKIFSVDFKGHSDFIESNIGLFGAPDISKFDDTLGEAHKRNWSSVRIIGNILYIILGSRSISNQVFFKIRDTVLSSEDLFKKAQIFDANDQLLASISERTFKDANSLKGLIEFNRNAFYRREGITKIAGDQPFKTCSCGKVYQTKEDFLNLPLKGFVFTGNLLDDPGLGCYYEAAGYDLLYRDCSCNSTMAIKISCPHK